MMCNVDDLPKNNSWSIDLIYGWSNTATPHKIGFTSLYFFPYTINASVKKMRFTDENDPCE